MADMLQTAVEWLDGVRNDSMSHAVTYARGEQSVELNATVGLTVFRLDDGTGGTIRVSQRDFLVRCSDLVIGGEEVLPQRGDRITETTNGKTVVWEVMGPGGGEPDWRYSLPDRSTLRIHVKEVG